MQYRKTFFTNETGGQMKRRLFLEGNKVMKADIMTNNKAYWSPIRSKVKAWVKEGWATWEEEKPEWFTDKWKASVPEDMKPANKSGDVDSGLDSRNNMAPENEGEEALTVGGGEEQKGRRRSVLELISGQKAASSKVMPTGGEAKKEFEIDEAEFMREMNRRGSINM